METHNTSNGMSADFARHHILADPAFTATITTYERDDADIEALRDGRMRILAFAMYSSITDSSLTALTSFTILYSTTDGAIYEMRYMGDIGLEDALYNWPGFDGNFFSHRRMLDAPVT